MEIDLFDQVHLGQKSDSPIKIQGFDNFSNVTSSMMADRKSVIEDRKEGTPNKQRTPKNTDIFSDPEI